MQIYRPRYMDVRTDFGFEKLFGQEESKPVLKRFLYELLDRPAPIAELNFLPPEQLARAPLERRGIFDIDCIDENGHRFHVEMQKPKAFHFINKALYDYTLPIIYQADRKHWDYQLHPVYCVGILDFILQDDPFNRVFQNGDQYIHWVKLIDETTHKVFSDKLTFVYVELPKFNLELEALETVTDKWIYFMKHVSEFQEIPEALSEPPFDLALHLIELAQLTAEEYNHYEGSLKQARDRYAEKQTAYLQGREEGREEGREIGEKRKATKIAQALIKQQVPLETVLQVTGLTEEDIQPFES